MTRPIRHLLACAALLAVLASPALATHDSGLGKSQDQPTDVMVATEPATGLLFLAGAGLAAWRLRKRRK